ncbi:MAG: AbrB/MazE/SpoVT family DNA-binding domain-containing protein [Patescibacteria group bacterium]
MTQKVLKVGTSAAVTIPKESLKELGLKIGDRVIVKVDRQKRVVSIRPITRVSDKELVGWTEKFIERYRPALEALAKK